MTSAKPIVVGGFVLGALALAVIAILTFGGMHLFAKNLRAVVVFKDSIAGLEVGAPVTFRGVRIGRVEGMRLHLDELHHTSWIPVYLEVFVDRISWVNGSSGATRAGLQAAVNSGLRAQLAAQSLVSGQMSVNLDYHPDTRAEVRASQAGDPDEAFEIPTIPSDIQNLKDELRNLDLPAIGAKVEQVMASMQRVLGDIDGKIGPVAADLQSALSTTTAAVRNFQQDAARTVADIDRLANESRGQIAANGKDLDELLQAAARTTDQADRLVASLNDMASPRGDLQASLRDLAASSSSLRSLTQDLERNPVGTLLRREK